MQQINNFRALRGALAALAAGVLLAMGVGVVSRPPVRAQDLPATQAELVERALSDELTREQLATLYQDLTLTQFQPPHCLSGQEMFDDVPASNQFCPWIEEMARRGVTGGCTATNYCPNSPVTRAQMAVFTVKATEACARGIKAHVEIILASVSTTQYDTAGLQKIYMCRSGTVYAKRTSVGSVSVAFHPTGQTGQFGTNMGGFPIANSSATGPNYFANASGPANPGDPPTGFDTITAYRVRVADDEGNPVNQWAKIAIF